ATFTGLVFWVMPTLAFTHASGALAGGSWAAIAAASPFARGALFVATGLFGVLALAAVAELARVGEGTPFPWDPPRRLVRTGPYAYVANPMQLGACALVMLLAVATQSWFLVLAGISSIVFSEAIAHPHERATLATRWPEYADHTRSVRAWLPRWRPAPVTGRLWVSEECAVCQDFGAALAVVTPLAGGTPQAGGVPLSVLAAEDAPAALSRMRWEGAGVVDDGVAAFARAIEQTNLAAAWLGWLIRLPGVRSVIQIVVDACGLEPQLAVRDVTGPHR
ncbi:MAG: methyltransferase, partial [Nocardioides sp.]